MAQFDLLIRMKYLFELLDDDDDDCYLLWVWCIQRSMQGGMFPLKHAKNDLHALTTKE